MRRPIAREAPDMASIERKALKTGSARKSPPPAKPPQRSAAEARAVGPASPVPADATAMRDRSFKIGVGNRVFSVGEPTLGGRTLDILPDMPDIRDRIYQPHLRPLRQAIDVQIPFPVRDQGADASCTGFSLAHIIDFLRLRDSATDGLPRVSARMLYEMAKRNDEWAGSAYQGSSIRGAIKGFFRNGVCSDEAAPDVVPGVGEWTLTYQMAKEARETRLGAYFRVESDINDYHAALNDVGAIYVSAQIHSGWRTPKDGLIEPAGRPAGGHAFAIVGYDDEGFWILNSWGPGWGVNGAAHWKYADWAATVMDAWVLQLGVRAPNAFGATPRATLSSAGGLFGPPDPLRADILGHFINIDDGRFVTGGKYGSPKLNEMQQTVDRLIAPSSNSGNGYDHLVIYAHGGLNDLADEARRIATWKRNDIWGRNKLYNFHLMWGSGLLDEIFSPMSESSAAGRAGGPFTDWMFDSGPGKDIGRRAWRNMKQDAHVAFGGDPEYDGGVTGLSPLLQGLDQAAKRPKLHLVGHSAGSVVLGYLLAALGRFQLGNLALGSIHLMAPGCTVEFFKKYYLPYLKGNGALPLEDKIYLYNLADDLEFDDTVGPDSPLLPSYSHSLLYLVSRAYEEKTNMPLAGMQIFAGGIPAHPKIDIAYSQPKGGVTASASHGGFDNDRATMTTIMARILGKKVPNPPTADELTGY
jgi:papain like protease